MGGDGGGGLGGLSLPEEEESVPAASPKKPKRSVTFAEHGGLTEGEGGSTGFSLLAAATDDTTASHTPARATSPRGRAILRSAMCSMLGFESSKPNKSTDQFGIEALVLELVLLSARPLADHKSGGK